MGLIYVVGNLIKDKTITFSTEDPLYTRKKLYNERPSLPYRTTSIAGVQYVCIDLGEPKTVTFVGIFNHNLTQPVADGGALTLLQLCGGAGAACADCTCDNDLTVAPTDLCDGCTLGQPIANFRNTWKKFDCSADYQWWKLNITDIPAGGETYIEIGELVLGEWKQFSRGPLTGAGKPWVRLSPGRADGPAFFMGKQRTHYGQDWSTFYSECERFELKFTSQNDPCLVDEIHAFLSAVQLTGGRFVLVPDDTKPFCYYVIIENLRDYADRLIYGRTRELREWRLELKTLTQGVVLLP